MEDSTEACFFLVAARRLLRLDEDKWLAKDFKAMAVLRTVSFLLVEFLRNAFPVSPAGGSCPFVLGAFSV